MPVVFHQKMAMNESVAATCCYRVTTTSAGYYNEVLNGGKLESGPANTLMWKDEAVSKDWALLDFDVDFTGYAGLRPVPVFNSLKQRWWVLLFRDDRIASAVSMDDFTTGAKALAATANPGCAHDSATCLYLAEGTAASLFNHVGASRAHGTGGDVWSQPHAAQQFHS